MMTGFEYLKYAIFYPEEDEPDYDGTHKGGVKTLRDDAPEWAWEQYNAHRKAEADGIAI